MRNVKPIHPSDSARSDDVRGNYLTRPTVTTYQLDLSKSKESRTKSRTALLVIVVPVCKRTDKDVSEMLTVRRPLLAVK
jgi:hypothetical protein